MSQTIRAVAACILLAAPAAASPSLTVHAQREPLSSFVQDVSRQAKVKLVLAKDLAGERISAYMNQVTVGDVLDVLKNFKGVEAHRTPEGYFLQKRGSRSSPVRITAAESPARSS